MPENIIEVTGVYKDAGLNSGLNNVITKLDEIKKINNNALVPFNNQLSTFTRKIKSNSDYIDTFGKTLNEVVEPIPRKMAKVTQSFEPIKRQFDGAAMSLMFFGMAMQRISQTIWQTGVKTYTDIMHSVAGTVTEFDKLNAASEVVKFSLGAALEPIAALLTPIIMKFAEWVQNNETLIQSLVIGFGIIGGIFAVGGALRLGLNGLFEKLGDIILRYGTLKDGLISTNWSQIGKDIQTGIGSIAIAFSVQQAFEAIEHLKKGEYWKATVDGIQSGLLAAGGGMLVAGKTGGGYLVAAALGIELVEQSKLFQTLGLFWSVIYGFFEMVGAYIKSVFTEGIVEGIKQIIIEILSSNTISKILALKGISTKDALRDLAGLDTPPDVDYWGEFKKGFQESQGMFKKWDDGLTNLITDLNTTEEVVKSTVEGTKFITVENKNGNFAGVTQPVTYNIMAYNYDDLVSSAGWKASSQGQSIYLQ